MLSWASRFDICCFLDNHTYQLPAHSLECLLAAGAIRSIRANAGNAFDQLKEFAAGQTDWLFGHFGYGLAKETEGIAAPAPDPIGFPDLYFFIPEILIELSADSIRIGSCGSDHAAILEQIGREAIPREEWSTDILRGKCSADTPGGRWSSDTAGEDCSADTAGEDCSADTPGEGCSADTAGGKQILRPRFSGTNTWKRSRRFSSIFSGATVMKSTSVRNFSPIRRPSTRCLPGFP